VAIQHQARRDVAHAQAADDTCPRRIFQGISPYPSSEDQICGVSSLELSRVLHVPFQQMCVTSPPCSFVPRIEKLLASEQVTIGLRANVNTPASSGVDTPAYSWFAEGTAGVRQHAYRADAVYTPLYCMKFIRKPLLRRDEKPQGPEK
jgi:hypothetical protein